MLLNRPFYTVFVALALLCALSPELVAGSRSSEIHSNARRSLSNKRGLARRQDDGPGGLPQVPGPEDPRPSPPVVPSPSPSPEEPPAPEDPETIITTTSSTATVSSSSSSTTTSATSTDEDTPRPTPTPAVPSTTSDDLPTSTSDSTILLPPTSTVVEEPTPTPTPTESETESVSSSSSSRPGLTDILSSILNPPTPTPSSSESSDLPEPTPEPSTVPTPGPEPSLSTSAPPEPTPSSTQPEDPISSILSSILNPPTPTSEPPVPPTTTLEPEPPITTSEPPQPPTTTLEPEPPITTSEPPQPPTTTLEPEPPITTSDPPVPPTTTLDPEPPITTSDPPVPPTTTLEPEPPITTSDPPVPPTTTQDPEPPITTSDPPRPPTTTAEPPITTSDTEISFPGGPSSTTTEFTTAPTSVPDTKPTSISLPPDLSFVFSETELAVETQSSSSATITVTDPDAVPTTSSAEESAPTTGFVLPQSIPNRIYPQEAQMEKPDREGKTLVSLLFDSSLNWNYVYKSPISPSQMFLFMPLIISTAIGVEATEVKNFALQVSIPLTYKGPEDISQLGTVWLGYVPTELVATLASQIKVKASPFYTGMSHPVAIALASHVVPGFSVNSVPDADANGGSSNNSGSGGQSGAASNNGKQRQDAIIGVVSSLGAVALIVLGFLIYRSIQRKKELAHRRLSDPIDNYMHQVPPPGRDFDQDSIGGQRRRSFYFAEDATSFHNQQEQAGRASDYGYQTVSHVSPSPSPNHMVQRRGPTGPISAPVLQGSSMNW